MNLDHLHPDTVHLIDTNNRMARDEDAFEQAETVSQMLWEARKLSRKAYHEQYEKYEAMRQKLAQRFARHLGLKRARYISASQLAHQKARPGRHPRLYWSGVDYDHPFDYKVAGRAAAVVVHIYGSLLSENLAQRAASMGLRAEIVEWFPSWHFPGRTKLVLYTSGLPVGPNERVRL